MGLTLVTPRNSVLDANAKWSSAQRYACGVLLLVCARNVTLLQITYFNVVLCNGHAMSILGVIPSRVLSEVNAKLNKLNKFQSDVSEIKESITNTQDDNIFNDPSAAEATKLLVNPIN